MTMKDDFPWYVVMFAYCAVVGLTYVVFLLAALACNKLVSAYRYERLFSNRENLALADFSPRAVYIRVDQRNSGSRTTIFLEKGLVGKFSTGKEIVEAELAWENIRSQVAKHMGIPESDLESHEFGVYKKLMESPKWSFSISGPSTLNLMGNDSTDDLYVNGILRKIDLAKPFEGVLPQLKMTYQKQFPRLTSDRVEANSKSKAAKAILLISPFCIAMGFIFSRFMPFSWLPNLVVTLSFFLIMGFTGPFQMSLLTSILGRTEFKKSTLLLYQDGTLQLKQKIDG